MVALNILYNVGSRDEHPDRTGMAHLFEHLMFGGSVNVPDYDGAIEHAGGRNNAWTNQDYTNFYDIVPAQNAETAFWLESDRMLSLAFSDKALEVQRNVVMEEFKQVCLNQPYGDLSHHLSALAYTVHPYRTPVIGKELSHIQAVTQDDVRNFFRTHYAPNNAVLAVTGNISLEETRRLAEKWFGGIPRREVAARTYAAEPVQTAERRKTVSGPVPQTMMVVSYPMPGCSHPDYPVCDIITDLLAAGRTSRYYRHLIMGTELFTSADASISGSEEPGQLMLQALLRPGVDEEEARRALIDEARSLVTSPPDDHELKSAVNRFEVQQVMGKLSYVNLASSLAMDEMRNTTQEATLARYRAITAADIVRVADEIFRPERSSTLIYRPMEN
jgi:predicted Zn-dependent peptidase